MAVYLIKIDRELKGIKIGKEIVKWENKIIIGHHKTDMTLYIFRHKDIVYLSNKQDVKPKEEWIIHYRKKLLDKTKTKKDIEFIKRLLFHMENIN